MLLLKSIAFSATFFNNKNTKASSAMEGTLKEINENK